MNKPQASHPDLSAALRLVALGVLGLLLSGILAPGLGESAAARWGGDLGAWSVALTLPIQGLWMAGLAWLASQAYGDPQAVLGWRAPRRWASILLVLPAGWAVSGVVASLGRQWPGLDQGGLAQFEHSTAAAGPATPWLALGVCLAAPLGEELLFRGFVYRGALRWGPWGAAGISAALFGLYHMDPLHGLGAAGLGLLLAWLRWYTGGVLVPIFAHALNNLLWFVLVRLGHAPAPPSPLPLLALTLVLVGVLVLLSRRVDVTGE